MPGLFAGVAAACGGHPSAPAPGRLAYSVGPDSSTAQQGIQLVDADGANRARLTVKPPPRATSVEWSPAGDKLLFDTENDGVWTINPDGTAAQRIARGFNPSWSPDGHQVALYGDPNGDIGILSSTGGRRTIRLGLSERGNRLDDLTDSRPQWSPDGSRIAFEVYTETADADFSVIYVVGVLDRRPKRRLVMGGDRNGVYDTEPVWSPDGRWIAFVRTRNTDTSGVSDAWKIRPDGSELTLVARDADAVQWSPDGGSIFYRKHTALAGHRRAVYLQPLSGGSARQITTVTGMGRISASKTANGIVVVDTGLGTAVLDSRGQVVERIPRLTDGSFAPGGKRAAYVAGVGAIGVVGANGSGKRLLTVPSEGSSPDWSPNGQRIAYVRTETGGATSGVYVIDVAGHSERRVGAGGAPLWSPDGTAILVQGPKISILTIDPAGTRIISEGRAATWSPDGGTIAFVRDSTRKEPPELVTVRSTLYSIRRDGTGLRALAKSTTRYDSIFGSPTWASDGKSIVVAEADRQQGGNGRILRVDAEGGVETILDEPKLAFTDLVLSPDRKRGVFTDPLGATETVVLDTGDLKRLFPTHRFRYAFAWSPDGKQLAFLASTNADTGGESLFVVYADGSHERQVSRPGEPVGSFDWLPAPETG